jgi:hypothetical protein
VKEHFHEAMTKSTNDANTLFKLNEAGDLFIGKSTQEPYMKGVTKALPCIDDSVCDVAYLKDGSLYYLQISDDGGITQIVFIASNVDDFDNKTDQTRYISGNRMYQLYRSFDGLEHYYMGSIS